MTLTGTAIGARQTRLEDEALLTGRARYTADIVVDGLLEAVFVRSPFAHARIRSVDTSAALELDGVVAVLTSADLPLGPLSFPFVRDLIAPDFHRRPVAGDTVRFVGDIVALVVAESAARAIDAAELVEVDYEPLPAVVDPVAAASDDAALLFPETGTNVALRTTFEAGALPEDGTAVVRETISNHRMAVSPMECNAVVAAPDRDTGRMTVHASTQYPHGLRDMCAAALDMDPADLRVIVPAVGGGFGGKTPMEPDYVAVLAAARHLGCPVRWVQSRTENLTTMQARGHRWAVTMRSTPEGKVTSLDVDALSDLGAYPGIGCGMAMTTRALATGAYDIPHLRFDLRGVATNTAPIGAFRGAGRPEAIALVERAMDLMASELRMDPVDLRRRNLIRPQQFPYRTLTGLELDSGDYERSLEAALEIADYDGLRIEQAGRRQQGEARHLGVGVCCYVELSGAMVSPGLTPLHVDEQRKTGTPESEWPGNHTEFGSVEVRPDGRAVVVVGTSDHGQGHHTTFAQIVAGSLGMAVDQVDFVAGDTQKVERGGGTGAARSTQMGGAAVKAAADEVLGKARRIAAHLLEADPADVAVVPGGLAVSGVPASTLSWAALAEAANDPTRLPDAMEAGLFAAPGYWQTPFGTAPFGTHVAVVEVDGETGAVDLLRMVAVDDCGVVINPLLAEGQVHGGLLGGISQALFEEVVYGDDGTPLTPTFAQYGFPSAAELPSFETSHTVTPSPCNPLGVKGLGEAGITGSLGAVHNAVVDAVSHLGIRHIDLPLSPMRVWAAIQEATR